MGSTSILFVLVMKLPAKSVIRVMTVYRPSERDTAPDCQDPPPSREFAMLCTPEIASSPLVENCRSLVYQPFEPSTGGTDTEILGGVVSRLIVPLAEAVFPALSVAMRTNAYVPSEKAVNEVPPPLMLRLFIPEPESLPKAEAVTGPDMNQPFCPSGDGMDSASVGARLSTISEADPIVEVSPQEESAQKVRLVIPSGNDQVQDGPLHNIPASPSMPVMLYPANGSLPDRLMVPVPVHQPLFPDTLQTVDPLTIAGG